MNKGPEIRAFKSNHRLGIGVFIEEFRDNVQYDAEPVVMKAQTQEDYFRPMNPTVSLSPTAAQQLIDDLWDCGLRPSEGSGSAGAMAATQRHLEDMRALVFNPEMLMNEDKK